MVRNEESKIEEREKTLYSRTTSQSEPVRSTFTPHNYDIKPGWKKKGGGDAFSEAITKTYVAPVEKKSTFFNRFLVGSIVFFVLAVLTFLYRRMQVLILYRQKMSIFLCKVL